MNGLIERHSNFFQLMFSGNSIEAIYRFNFISFILGFVYFPLHQTSLLQFVRSNFILSFSHLLIQNLSHFTSQVYMTQKRITNGYWKKLASVDFLKNELRKIFTQKTPSKTNFLANSGVCEVKTEIFGHHFARS